MGMGWWVGLDWVLLEVSSSLTVIPKCLQRLQLNSACHNRRAVAATGTRARVHPALHEESFWPRRLRG